MKRRIFEVSVVWACLVLSVFLVMSAQRLEETMRLQRAHNQSTILAEHLTRHQVDSIDVAYVVKWSNEYNVGYGLTEKILEYSREFGIPYKLAFNLIRTESGFKPCIVSWAGAVGLTQVMPATARYLDHDITSREQLCDPDINLRLGFTYLTRMIDRFDQDTALALSAYNGGPGNVLKGWRNPSYERSILQ